ncbi:MAG TPA: AMP-binding protein [Polyangia bacterium]|jgi:1-acyl-sn-glycerol-3-phosphate acyltransferase|nr:AMP-binding protein [Polyangia bacterium]
MPARGAPASDVDGETLLNLVREVAGELHAGRGAPPRLDSRLEDDLGLDSLARMELLLRIQRRFGVALPERAALGAETPRALLAALSVADAHQVPGSTPATSSVTPAYAVPPDTASVVEALIWYARRQPHRVHAEISESDDRAVPVTYGQLLAEAQLVAGGLAARGVGHGDSVALMLPTGMEFFSTFLGIQLLGAVPVPIYPPFRASQLADHLLRQARILENARAVLLVGAPELGRAADWLRNRIVGLRGVATVPELARAAGQAPATPRASDVALLQYTSGSTGDPKGVVLTHANLIANIRAIGEAAHIASTDVVVSWLPLYHDMGLIGSWLASLYHGCRFVVLPPTRFMARPASWLWALHRHRGTLAAAPNFAYEACASRVPDAELEGLDLGSWRLALNGSEPVSPATLDRFARRFAPHGFRPEAMMPVYGLAENAVALTFTPAGRGPRVEHVQRAAFERDGLALPADGNGAPTLAFVSSGVPLPRHEVRVVGELGRELPDRHLGEIQFRGPSATRGYFRNEAATRALHAGDWLVTGDLGYFGDGELFVTGRSKDVIIRAGRHVFPYEIEEAVGRLDGVRRGGVAVFPVRDEARGTEAVIVVAETRETAPERLGQLRSDVAACSARALGAAADDVALVPPRTVPKTSSGKTRREACRDLYVRGALGHSRSTRRQKLSLAVRLVGPLVRRGLRALVSVAYAGWFWTWMGLLAIPAWVIAVAWPDADARWRAVSAFVRAFFRGVGVPLRLAGREHLDRTPCVLVLNHASNLDGIALVGLLPRGFTIVAKRELARNILLAPALRRLGVLFVERFDQARAARETAAFYEELSHGRSLAIFPEGTNRRAPGLYPFHLGAFSVAARAGVPVVPGGIQGSRTVLRPDQWFPRRGAVSVVLRPPLDAATAGWTGIIALRDRARAEVADAADEVVVD